MSAQLFLTAPSSSGGDGSLTNNIFSVAGSDRVAAAPADPGSAAAAGGSGRRCPQPEGLRRGHGPLGGRSLPAVPARRKPGPAAPLTHTPTPPPGDSPQTPPLPAASGSDEFERPQPGGEAVAGGWWSAGTVRAAQGGRAGSGCRRVSAPGTRVGIFGKAGAVGDADLFRGSRGNTKLGQGELSRTKYLDGNKGTFRSKGEKNQTNPKPDPNPERASRVRRFYRSYQK